MSVATTWSRPADLATLTKPRIVGMVGITVALAFFLAHRGPLDWLGLLMAVLGSSLLTAGAATLNQLIERDTDSLMPRTADRPLPAGRMGPESVLLYGLALSVSGLVVLSLGTNTLTALLGAFTLTSYVFLYTPLKRVSPLAVIVGAVPGAMPPMMGWAAATGRIDFEAWTLFAILFLWQLPHFLAIAWIYREDYARGGFPVLPVVDPSGRRTAHQSILWGTALLPVSLAPAALGLAGPTYFVGALALGLAFLGTVLAFARALTPAAARRVFRVSLVYVPMILLILVMDRLVG